MDDNKPPDFDQESFDAVQALIQRLSTQLDTLKTKQQELNQMLKNVFENDEDLQQAEIVAKEQSVAVKDRKSQITQTNEVMELKMKIVDIREDLKMVQESLNTHLLNYYQMTNSMTFPTESGGEREFKIEAKLKPQKK